MTLWPLAALAAALMVLYLVTTPAPRRSDFRRVLGACFVGLGIYALHFSAVEAYSASTDGYSDAELARFWGLLSIPLSIFGALLVRGK